jgi:CRISPR system Cascade subunit CasE
MIASLYRLSRKDLAALKVTDEYSLHRIVYDLFPEREGNESGRDFLYADKGGDFRERIVLILSHRSPTEPTAGRIESREVSYSFLSQDRYAFEVVMNPSRRDSKTGKTVAIRGETELRDWFAEKSSAWGFSIEATRLEVSRIGVQSFAHKDDGMIVHGRATFSGILEVTNRPAFIGSFENGIGRCRGFGFGLLQIRPIERASVNA